MISIMEYWQHISKLQMKTEIIDSIFLSDNEYSKHVLLNKLKYIYFLKTLSPALLSKLRDFSIALKPLFTAKKNESNIIDVNGMQAWISMSSNIEYISHGKEPHIFIYEFLTDDATDARYTVSYLLSPEFEDFYLKFNSDKKSQTKIDKKINKAIELSKKDGVFERDMNLQRAISKFNGLHRLAEAIE